MARAQEMVWRTGEAAVDFQTSVGLAAMMESFRAARTLLSRCSVCGF